MIPTCQRQQIQKQQRIFNGISKYKIDYIIKVKNGAFIKEYSEHPAEDEVLLLPGSKFKVIDIDQDIFTDDESYLITLELEN